ncbi:MAG TPA: prepilin-type N-terminal cleavage/methylation domain-containing protein [Stellaceae bacterium]|nr:prepilin-type N-terminal cleavage/methylation domain-containing protein [Stellaceae bacterium]
MSKREAGFTLVEVLVALALTAVVSLILLGGIRLAATGLDRHARQAERFDAQRSLDDILRRTLGSAAIVPGQAGGFVGRPDAVAFLAIAEDSGAGLYRIEIAIDKTRTDRRLILQRRLAVAGGDPRSAASVLAANIGEFRLTYFGADGADAEPAWHDRWEGLGTLPLLVQVIVDTGDAPRPPLIVHLWNAG